MDCLSEILARYDEEHQMRLHYAKTLIAGAILTTLAVVCFADIVELKKPNFRFLR